MVRVFIDARDLINIFNHDKPISPDELATRMRAGKHQLVLPFSLISELIPRDNHPLVVARRFVKIEEDIPHVFFQQRNLLHEEIACAVRDVAGNQVPSPCEPYRGTFQEMWGDRSDPIFMMDLERTVGVNKMSRQLGLLIEKAPEIFRWAENDGAELVRILESEQAAHANGTKDTFSEAVTRWMGKRRHEKAADPVTFSKFLRRNPSVAPGWQLYMEVFDHLVRDPMYKPTVNDAWDLSNVAMLPYVDALTLDKGKVDLVRRATRQLRQFDPAIDYSDRTFARVDDLIARL